MYFLLNIIYLIKIFLMIGVLLTFLQFLKSETINVPRLKVSRSKYIFYIIFFDAQENIGRKLYYSNIINGHNLYYSNVINGHNLYYSNVINGHNYVFSKYKHWP